MAGPRFLDKTVHCESKMENEVGESYLKDSKSTTVDIRVLLYKNRNLADIRLTVQGLKHINHSFILRCPCKLSSPDDFDKRIQIVDMFLNDYVLLIYNIAVFNFIIQVDSITMLSIMMKNVTIKTAEEEYRAGKNILNDYAQKLMIDKPLSIKNDKKSPEIDLLDKVEPQVHEEEQDAWNKDDDSSLCRIL